MNIKWTIMLLTFVMFGVLYTDYQEKVVMKDLGLKQCLIKVDDNYFVEAWRKSCE